MTNVTIANVTMSLEAARSVEWAGVDVAADVRRVREEGNCDGLLADCLEGCEPEHEADWRDYVSAVCAAAEAEQDGDDDEEDGADDDEAREITHRVDPVTGHMLQIVSAARLTEILLRDGETLDRPKHFGPSDEWEVEVAVCESGEATGEPCAWDGDASELVTVEYMPEYLRESHRAAGGWGSYPHNGAWRLRCCPDCAEMLQADEAEQEGEEPITVTVRNARYAEVGDTICGDDGNAWRIVALAGDRARVILGDWDDVPDDDVERGCEPRALVSEEVAS